MARASRYAFPASSARPVGQQKPQVIQVAGSLAAVLGVIVCRRRRFFLEAGIHHDMPAHPPDFSEVIAPAESPGYSGNGQGLAVVGIIGILGGQELTQAEGRAAEDLSFPEPIGLLEQTTQVGRAAHRSGRVSTPAGRWADCSSSSSIACRKAHRGGILPEDLLDLSQPAVRPPCLAEQIRVSPFLLEEIEGSNLPLASRRFRTGSIWGTSASSTSPTSVSN